jgi:hypothetical protein
MFSKCIGRKDLAKIKYGFGNDFGSDDAKAIAPSRCMGVQLSIYQVVLWKTNSITFAHIQEVQKTKTHHFPKLQILNSNQRFFFTFCV